MSTLTTLTGNDYLKEFHHLKTKYTADTLLSQYFESLLTDVDSVEDLTI